MWPSYKKKWKEGFNRINELLRNFRGNMSNKSGETESLDNFSQFLVNRAKVKAYKNIFFKLGGGGRYIASSINLSQRKYLFLRLLQTTITHSTKIRSTAAISDISKFKPSSCLNLILCPLSNQEYHFPGRSYLAHIWWDHQHCFWTAMSFETIGWLKNYK